MSAFLLMFALGLWLIAVGIVANGFLRYYDALPCDTPTVEPARDLARDLSSPLLRPPLALPAPYPTARTSAPTSPNPLSPPRD